MSLDGKMIQPNNKKFKVDFCTVAHWKNGKIIEEKLFYDLVRMMSQSGLMPGTIESACQWAFVKIESQDGYRKKSNSLPLFL